MLLRRCLDENCPPEAEASLRQRRFGVSVAVIPFLSQPIQEFK